MITPIFSLIGAVLKALPLLFSFMAGKNYARSRSMATKARAKANQADISARPNKRPDDIVDRMRNGGL